MVNAVATRNSDGGSHWSCGTAPSRTKSVGNPLLDRHVHVTVTDLPATAYHLRHGRLDEKRSNLNLTWRDLGRTRLAR